jgi:hypothetical protein
MAAPLSGTGARLRPGALRAMVVAFTGVLLGGAIAVGAGTALQPSPPVARLSGAEPLEAGVSNRESVGSISVGADFQPVLDRLGQPDASGPDIDGTAHTWRLRGVVLTVAATADDTISSIHATVVGEGAGPQLAEGVVLGRTTLAELRRRWGQPTRVGGEGDDFVVAYDGCVRGIPIVRTFDQAVGATGDERPVTSVVLGWADEAGC